MPTESHDLRLNDARARLRDYSPKLLSANELLGIVLGTGAIGRAIEISEQLISTHGGLLGIARLNLRVSVIAPAS